MHRYAEIIIYRTYAELKTEASRGYLGVLWWVIEPLIYLGMFYFFFTIVRGQTDAHLVQFLFVGLAVWKWFATTIPHGAKSILFGKGLMRQVYLPKYIFPFIAVLGNFAKFLILLMVLLAVLLFSGIAPTWSWLALPLLIGIQFVLLLGICGFLAAIVPFLPDLNQIINNLLMILFFLSGVIFDLNNVPEEFRQILFINPLAVLIAEYRQVLIEGQFPNWSRLVIITVASLALWAMGNALIRRFDRVYPKVFM